MKVDGYDVPEHLFYTKDHAWVLIEEGRSVKIGITDYAQQMLKEITFVYLPEQNATFESSDVFGTVESIKAISEIYSPFSGTIVEINEKLRGKPRIINEDPYGEGWIVTLRPSRLEEETKLLVTPEQYATYLKNMIKIDTDLLIFRWREKNVE